MADDSRATKMATGEGGDPPSKYWLAWAADQIEHIEKMGLVVTDPTAAPYSLVTHEYPPTMELAIAAINQLANTNHALHMHLAAAWEKGHATGRQHHVHHHTQPLQTGDHRWLTIS